MEIKTLRSFIAIAETESFSAAASRMSLTQSAVSRHVKSLEEELDVQLFVRKSHSVSLTENGFELLERAKRIIRETDDCVEHMKSINGNVGGELRIGVGSFIEPSIRVAAIQMMEKYPDVRLNVEFGKACRLNQMLREHKIDLAFTMNTAQRDEGITSESCIPFNIRAIMSRTHPLADMECVTYDDLKKFSVIMPDVGERVFNTIQHYMDVDLSRLKVKAIVNSAGAALSVLDEARLITFLPDIYIEKRPDLIAKAICGLNMDLISNAHWLTDTPLKRSAVEFINIIREYSIPLIKAKKQ